MKIFWNESICLDLAWFVLCLFLFGIGCLLGENCFDSEMSGIDLACNTWVVVYPAAVPVNIISKWEKSQLWIKLLRGENPYNGVKFAFAFEGGTFSQGATKPDLWKGEILAAESDLRAEEILPRRILIPARRSRKAHRLICVNTFTRGHISSRSVQTWFSKWRHIPSAEDRSSALECGKSHSLDRKAAENS